LKIIQTCGSLSWGGLEKIALQTSGELAKCGHDVSFLCKKDSILSAEAKKAGINRIEIFSDDKFLLKSVRKIKQILLRGSFDVVHSHLSHDLWSLVPAIRKSRTKLFLTKHMGSYISKKDILHKYLYKRVNGIFAISNYVKDSLLKTCPVKENKIHLLPDFILLNEYYPDINLRDKIRKQYNITTETTAVGMAGRFTPGKGHEDLIEAAKIIRSKTKNKIKFMVAGGASRGEEEYENKIRQIVDSTEIKNDFIFTGYTNELPKIMNAMDIFIMPSHEESFGIVLLEAMAMRLPVIAADNAGAKDIVINNESGLLVKPKNPELLGTKILDLMNNKENMKKLGSEGRKRVEQNFSSDKIISRLEEYYVEKW
jgi:glycosyltransferase involved in cell wall biosynthesis